MHNVPPYYGLADGRIWSISNATFVEAGDAALAAYRASGGQLGTAPDSAGELTVTGLREVLEFYDLPLGVLMPLSEAQTAKRQQINARFDAAITASLTMPSASSPPSAYAVYTALEEWKAEDAEGFTALLAIHTARRDELLAAVEAATTVEAIQAIAVSYAV